ncbi:MAG: hypothetical protein MPJ78_17695 [Hyphomicrobiaceae bacterium]|nr:hypothetical protein [Hyphomicrobiaceae bacterium]
MTGTSPSKPLLKDRFFTTSLTSTIVVFALCLAKHILVIVGVSGAIAAADSIEHGLVFAVLALTALTVYAYFRHRKRATDTD